uniref:EF-hand domain-containing protein n=1 Tax=Vannella robusta TaxID=1487602 RepID=A0A7S4MIC8_9EUKA|mmetsp:Transcript_22968/g.29310  ORF Transcript_22968/g.29310 Transcript_22968/m.29310 type:complete len:339 (+) Transcript_22968:267-1283(+)
MLDFNSGRTIGTPKTLFEQYATVKGDDGQLMMTISDFLRVITPFETITNVDTSSFKGDLSQLLKSVDLDNDGLITYAEFIFFTTLLAIPPKYSRTAFRMFDSDGNGSVDADEFKAMMRLVGNPITSQSELAELLDGCTEGVFPAFFGKDGKKGLKYETFNRFIKHLRDEVSTVQFKMISNGKETISAQEYALSLISYGSTRNNPANLTRVAQLQNSDIRISMDEYKSFLSVLEFLEEIDFVLRSFLTAGEPFSKQQLRRAAKAVARVDLTDDVLDVVFFVFDTSGDGKLDEHEFMDALQGRQQFGFSKPKDAGFVRFGKCMKFCWHEEISDRSAKPIV